MRRRQRRSDCPIHFGLEAFGDAWSLLIVRDLIFKDRSTYTDFLRAEEGIATNVLADRLVRLEEDGIIVKLGGESGGGTYRITPKGLDLLPVLVEIIDWSARHDPESAVDRRFLRRLRAGREALLAELRAELEPRSASPPSPRKAERRPPSSPAAARPTKRKERS